MKFGKFSALWFYSNANKVNTAGIVVQICTQIWCLLNPSGKTPQYLNTLAHCQNLLMPCPEENKWLSNEWLSSDCLAPHQVTLGVSWKPLYDFLQTHCDFLGNFVVTFCLLSETACWLSLRNERKTILEGEENFGRLTNFFLLVRLEGLTGTQWTPVSALCIDPEPGEEDLVV